MHPFDDIRFPDQVQRSDQFHALKVGTVKLWHHRLDLCSIEHTHQNRFDHIIKVMSKCDLITAKLLCLAVQIASSHTGTQIAGRFCDIRYRVKDLRFKNSDRHLQKLCIIQDRLIIQFIIAGVHHEIYHFKILFSMTLKLLKKLGHQHGILTA